MKKAAAISIAAFLLSCVPYMVKIEPLGDLPLAPVKTGWENYGAYYEIDDLSIETAYGWSPVMEGPQTMYIVKKRLRILTNEGVPYASVPAPFYAPLSRFAISLKDASGKPVKLNTYQIREDYLKTGIIVFPKATAGCVLDITIVFQAMSSISTFEFAFYEAIPIRESTFSFTYPSDKYTYDFKSYGDSCAVRDGNLPRSVIGSATQRIWSRRDLLPPPRIAYRKNIYETVSRVSLVMRSYSTGRIMGSDNDVFARWNKLAESYYKYLFQTSVFQSTKKLERKARDLSLGVSTDSGKADAILRWVQDSISVNNDDSKAINPDRVIEKREGSIWEVTYVLKRMLGEIDCYSDIIVTRGKHRGGFDSAFVTPITLSLPIVIAECDKKKFVAYPYFRGSKLGEYPASFFGLKGLSLQSGDIKPLPEPPSSAWKCCFSYALGFFADSISQHLTARFSDYWAYDLRTDLVAAKKEDIKEYFQKMLTNFGLSNALLSCSVQNLDERGAPLTVLLSFATPGQIIERKGRKLYKLDHLFGSYFSFYDTTRAVGFTTDMDEVISEEIVAEKSNKTGVEFHTTCDAVDNALFKVTCEEQRSVGEYRFARTLHIKKSDLSADAMRLIYPDILRLKGISESYVSFK